MSTPNYYEIFDHIGKLSCQPKGTNIFVRKLWQQEKKTESGIVIANNADRPDRHVAIVMAAGDKCVTAKPGQVIAISPVATSFAVTSEGEDLLVMDENQIFGIYQGEMPEGFDWESFGKEEAKDFTSKRGYSV